MPGFIENRLAKGMATGATKFKTPKGTGVLRVRKGKRGRGLFAVSPIKPGIDCAGCVFVLLIVLLCLEHLIATGTGRIVSKVEDAPDSQHYEWPGKRIFAFDAASDANLAVLVNAPATLTGSPLSNARYVRQLQGPTPMIKVRWC
jgi:hypothetical protein